MPKVNNLYSGLEYSVFTIDGTPNQIAEADQFIQDAIDNNKVDSIVSIAMLPKVIADEYGSGSRPKNITLYADRRKTFVDCDIDDDRNAYTPRNKKLLSYPFKFLTVDMVSDSHDYRFEYAKGGNDYDMKFLCSCAISPNPEIVIAPLDYNGVFDSNGDTNPNGCESVTLSGYPQCAFTIDSYRAWLAQSALPDVSAISAAGITAGVGGAAGVGAALAGAGAATVAAPIALAAAGAIGLIGGIASLINKFTKGSKTRGSQGSSTLTALREYIPHLRFMSIRKDQAKILDDYFDRFGYYCGRIKVPNRNVRQNWTYTKTQSVEITGNIPTADLDKIKSIYNRGITFWRNGYNVGNYSLPNQPG